MSPTDEHHPIRALLEEAVEDVEPRYGLDRIRARTTAPARRTWAWSAGGAVLATAATVAAVVALTHDTGRSDVAGPTAQPSHASPHRDTPLLRPAYLVDRTTPDARLVRELHPVESAAGALDSNVSDTVGGSTVDPDDRTLWPVGSVVRSARVAGATVIVNLTGVPRHRPRGMTRAQAAMALQQVVYTSQAVVGRPLPVTFLRDGRTTPTLLGETTSRPVPAASADDTLAAVQVATPVDGATVDGTFTVSGEASAFEANVQWELRQAGGVVKHGFATARECCTLSPYSFTVTAPPGDYTLVVHDEDVSDGEGAPAVRATKRVTVR